jgi:hypothetical protein
MGQKARSSRKEIGIGNYGKIRITVCEKSTLNVIYDEGSLSTN